MARDKRMHLSRREQQIMDVVYELGRATVAGVLRRLSDPPSYSAVRATLRILEDKGQLKHMENGPRYVYMPTVSRNKARQSALTRLLQTFFDGSTEAAVAALLDMESSNLSQAELGRLAEMIDQAKREDR